MNWAALLTFAALAASAGEPAPSWQAALVEASSSLSASEASFSEGRAGCPQGVTAETVLADDAAGRLPPSVANVLDARREDIRLLFSCRAIATGSTRACDPLGSHPARIVFEENRPRPAARPETLRFLCDSDLHDMSMARAMSSGSRKAFVAACLKHDAAGHRDFLPGLADQACAILAAGDQDPVGTCAKLEPLYSSGLPGSYCEGEISFFTGNAAHCSTLSAQAADRELCLASVAYRTRREKPQECSDSPVCAALASGKPGVCGVYERRALAPLCRDHYLPRALEQSERTLTALDGALAAAASALGPGTRHEAARLDGALEAAARLRMRAEVLQGRLAAARRPVVDPVAASHLDARLALFEGAARVPGKPACVKSASPEMALSLLTDSETSAKARAVLLSAILPWLERLYNARAFTPAGPAVCGELAPLNYTVTREKNAGDISFDLLCKTNYYEGLMAKAMMRGEPQMFELCRIRNLIGDRDFRLDSLDASCKILAENVDGVDKTCARLGPYFDNETIGGTCVRMMRYALGDETVCSYFVDPMVHERCEGYAAYRRGLKRTSLECGGSPQCLLLSGETKEPLRAAAAGLASASCEVYARPEIRAEFARRFAAQAEAEAQALIARPQEGSATRLSERAADAELERVARLQARALRLAERP